MTNPAVPIHRNIITGMNTQMHPSLIGITEAAILKNVSLSKPGVVGLKAGYTTESNEPDASNEFVRIEPYGTSLLGVSDTDLYKWTGSGDWSSLSSAFTNTGEAEIVVGSVSGVLTALISDGSSVVKSYNGSSVVAYTDTNTDPPKFTGGIYAKDRYFVWSGSKIWISDVNGDAFIRDTNFFLVNEGSGGDITNIILHTEDILIIFKEGEKWYLHIPTNSSPLSNWTLKSIDKEDGCPSYRAAVKAGNNIYYYSSIGRIRDLSTNEQGKIVSRETSVSDPIHTDYFDSITFANRNKIRMTVFNNQVLVSVPYESSTYSNWVFTFFLQSNPQYNGWAVWDGYSISEFCKFTIDGEPFLFMGDGESSQMYKSFTGTNDNGSAISWQIRSRMEDLSEVEIESTDKYGLSMYLKFRGEESESRVLVQAQRDEEGFTNVDTGIVELLSELTPLPSPLPAELKSASLKKFKLSLEDFQDWYNFQYNLSNDQLDQDFELHNIMLLCRPNKYQYAS